jgi:ribosomal protein S20
MFKSRQRTSLFAIATMISILLMSFANVSPVFAQNQQPSATPPPPAASPSATTGTNRANLISQLETFFFNDLATQLGTTVDKLKTAITTAIQDTLGQAVSKGAITQSQADQAKSRLSQNQNNGNLPGFGMFGGFAFGGMRGGFRGGFNNLLNQAEIAKALGIDQTTLQSDLKAGQTLTDIAKAQNIDYATFKARVLADAKTTLDAAVNNKTITATQEQNELARLSSMLDVMATQKAGRFGMPGFKGNRPNNNNANNGVQQQ